MVPVAFECPLFMLPALNAGEDLRAAQFKFLRLNSSGKLETCKTAGEFAVGVNQDKTDTGVVTQVMGLGYSKVVAGAALNPGQRVTTDTQGRAVAAAAGNFIAGVVIVGAPQAGAICTVYLCQLGLSA